MGTTEVIVPFAGDCRDRRRAWEWVRERLRYPVRVGCCEGPWIKARAVMPAIEASDAEIVVVHDADVWAPGLAEAVAAVQDGAAWAMPHERVYRLTDQATDAFMRGADLGGLEVTRRPYVGMRGGGVLVARRETLLEVPLDSRFIGWGNEDEAWGMALWTLLDEAWRGNQPLIHLWHHPAERLSDMQGSEANWALRNRYWRALRAGPEAMRALLSAQPEEIPMEFRCKSNPDFRLRKRGLDIQLKGGKYETDDPAEIKVLTDSPFVEVADSKDELIETAEERSVTVDPHAWRAVVEEAVVEDIVDEAVREERAGLG